MPYMDKDMRNAHSRAYNLAHREERNAYFRAYYQTHKKEWRAAGRIYRQTHREQALARNRTYRQRHREEEMERHRIRRQALHAEARQALGDKCACPGCGVCEPAFLTIDHIHGQPSKKDSIVEAKASGWDKSRFQILCSGSKSQRLGQVPVPDSLREL